MIGDVATVESATSVLTHLFTDHLTMGLVDVYAATIPQLAIEPSVHAHYQETVLRIHDVKPKMKDMPKEMGGSGATLAE